MSYDFAVLPSAAVSTTDEALEVYRAMCAAPQESSPPAAVRSFVAEINRRHGHGNDGFLSVETTADTRGAVVATWWPSLTRNLRAVLELTKDRDLAVLDVQTLRLYDPRGHANVLVTVGDGTTLPYLTETLLGELIVDPGSRFVVVEREPEHFIQTRRESDGGYELEHRVGSADHHFRVHGSDAALVRDVMWAWASEDPRWRDAVRWHRVDLTVDDREPM